MSQRLIEERLSERLGTMSARAERIEKDGEWVRAVPLADLRAEGRTVVRLRGRPIALFETPEGVFAINNRCPHEGYPLREGTVTGGCVLTCNWHNWKFDLRDGRNLYEGEGVRSYPVAVRGGVVWVDLAEPALEQRRAAVFAGLRQAFDDADSERISREVARLAQCGADPLDAIHEAVARAAPRMEYGWTHALAGAADWLALYDEVNGAERTLTCVAEAVAHLADDVLREIEYPFPQGTESFSEDALVAAIEAEDETRAARLMRGALAAGLDWRDLERGFFRAALAHYLGFGHSLIYCTKAGLLLARLGRACAEPVLFSLVRHLVFARREDRIPEFRRYSNALESFGQHGNAKDALDAKDFEGLGISRALSLTARHGRAEPDALYRALLGANARNMLRFDLRHQDRADGSISDNVGWLDFTHGVTFSAAVRDACSRFPDLWPAGLLQMACFAGRNARYVDADVGDEWNVSKPEAFFAETIEALFDHGQGEFIVSVHLLKTILAARGEWRHTGDPTLPAAVHRFLRSPLRRRHPRRTMRQAMRFARLEG
jgi:nitrite reductase/ring-hydroxylating ferredoxin subunit